MTHTILFTFGDATKNAAGAVCCKSLEIALREAGKAFANYHAAPLYEVSIRPGDHAPRLSNGESWVWPDRNGWQ